MNNNNGHSSKTVKQAINIEQLEKNPPSASQLNSELFRIALDHTFDHVIITDKDGEIIYMNRAGERVTGFTKEEAVGKKASLWGGFMSKDFYRQLWKTVSEEKKVFSREVENRRKSGKRYTAHLHIIPITNDTGEVTNYLAIEKDITREKITDRAKTEFASFASHQLRGPLATINICAEMLLDQNIKLAPEEVREYIREIHTSNHKMLTLINNLFDISRIEMGTFSIEPSDTDVRKLVGSYIEEFKHIADEKKVDLSMQCLVKNTYTYNDERMVGLIIENLISNAIKFTPAGGKVRVEVHSASSHSKKANIKDGFLISITDTGYGIPARDREKVFEKLFRAYNIRDKKVEGIGMGLFIVKTIVDHMNGTVWCTSKLNVGSTFHVLLPRIVEST